MKDIQNERDYRNISIDKVGIKNLRYPITVLDRKNGYQQTVASINMYVDLPHRPILKLLFHILSRKKHP
jgi:GTP cyclohydrolase I